MPLSPNLRIGSAFSRGLGLGFGQINVTPHGLDEGMTRQQAAAYNGHDNESGPYLWAVPFRMQVIDEEFEANRQYQIGQQNRAPADAFVLQETARPLRVIAPRLIADASADQHD